MNFNLDDFVKFVDTHISNEFKQYLITNGFFVAPASTKYHGAYDGGLLDHSMAVAKTLIGLTKDNGLKWTKPRSPLIVGLFHDLCKIDQYRKNTTTGDWEYNDNTSFTGHGDKSIMLLSQHIQLTEEEVMCVRYHMGAFTDKEEWSYYSKAIEKYPNVLWTHTADMIASKIIGM